MSSLRGWAGTVIDLTDKNQKPSDTFRESFTEVVMLPVLWDQLKVINPWLEDDQVEEVAKTTYRELPGHGVDRK